MRPSPPNDLYEETVLFGSSRQRQTGAVEVIRETGGVGVLEEQRAVRVGETPADVRPRHQIRGGQQTKAGVRRGSFSKCKKYLSHLSTACQRPLIFSLPDGATGGMLRCIKLFHSCFSLKL